MDSISGFRAIWHPGQNRYAITIRTDDGQEKRVAVDSVEEFIAIVTVLNGPSPALAVDGSITCSR